MREPCHLWPECHCAQCACAMHPEPAGRRFMARMIGALLIAAILGMGAMYLLGVSP